jgi:hypothetical protein
VQQMVVLTFMSYFRASTWDSVYTCDMQQTSNFTFTTSSHAFFFRGKKSGETEHIVKNVHEACRSTERSSLPGDDGESVEKNLF